MSFFAAVTLHNIYQDVHPKSLEIKEYIALGGDALLITALTILSALTATKLLPLLPAISGEILYIGLGTGAAIVLSSDLISLCVRYLHKPPAHKLIDEIKKAKDFNPTQDAIDQSSLEPFHKICDNLYLGSRAAFINCYDSKSFFDLIITTCPLVSLKDDCNGLLKVSKNEIFRNLANKGAHWLYVGGLVTDSSTTLQNGWDCLAYRCTFYKGENEIGEGEKLLLSQETEQSLLKEEKRIGENVKNAPILDLFEPVFSQIDEAIKKGKQVLVHDQAGQSSSADLVAAYLVNRHGCKADEAVSFLKSKRACVEPKFIQLQAYYQGLKNEEIYNKIQEFTDESEEVLG